MIEIKDLKEEDKGKWVSYSPFGFIREKQGIITWWGGSFIFVKFIDSYQEHEVGVSPKYLKFIKEQEK